MMANQTSQEKTIKCPHCNFVYSCVDMAPHGMWAIGTFQKITFHCVHCEKELLELEGYLSVTPENCLTFSRYYSQDKGWADEYYLKGGAE